VTLALEDIFIQQRRSSEKKSIRPSRQGWNVYRVVLLGDSHRVRGAMFHAQTRLTQRRSEIFPDTTLHPWRGAGCRHHRLL